MKEPRDDRDVELSEGEGLVRTTIVGGQPRKRPAIRMTVKVGLERVLYLAATDRHFRTAVLVDRTAALKAAGLSLSPSEAAILDAVGGDALASMIDAVQPRTRPQRPFLKSVAATFVTLATGTAQVGCGDVQSNGIRPDWDFSEPDLPADVRQDVGTDLYQDASDTPIRGIDAEVDNLYPDVGSDPGLPIDVADVRPDHGVQPDVPDDNPFYTDDLPMPAGILPDVPEMDADVREVFPDGGTQPDGIPFDAAPDDVLMDADAPVVGGILPDSPDVAAAAPEAAPGPGPHGGRA